MLVKALSAIAGVLIVAGCASKDGNGSPPQQVSRDRDESMVIAALRHVDACALIEPGARPPVATGPHRCAAQLADGGTITVTLGVRFDRQHKYRALPTEIGGAKAYLDASEPGTDSCQIAIPVSYDLTIAVVGRKVPNSGPVDICEPTRSAARAAVARLPDSLTGAATNWTACELLAASVGHSTGLANDGPTGLDTCTASDRGTALFGVNLDYGVDPTAGAPDVRTVAGRRMVVRPDNPGCSYLWSPAANLAARFHANDCAEGERLIPNVVNLLASPNPERTGQQRPLLMRPDEPDQPVSGACVDFPYGTGCQPATGATVPQGAQQIMNAATGDARVACAVAADAVRARFGTTMTPVLGSRTGERPQCYFVESSHTTVIEVSVRPDGTVADAGGSDTVLVAGRPARSARDQDSQSLCLLPVAGAKTGLLCLVAHFFPGRGKEIDSPVDNGRGALLEPTISGIVSRYFS